MNAQRSEFILESREHLSQFETSLLALEKEASTESVRSLVDQGLRAAHSLKGDSGFLGYTSIRNLTHAMESALEPFRGNGERPPVLLIEALLRARDRLASLIEDLDHSNSADISDHLARLESFVNLPRNNSQRLTIDIKSLANSRAMIQLCSQLALIQGITHRSISCSPPLDLSQSLLEQSSTSIELELFVDSMETQRKIEEMLAPETPAIAVKSERNFSVDLESLADHGTSMVNFVRQTLAAGQVDQPVLNYSAFDLAQQLPQGPVLWECHYTAHSNHRETAPMETAPSRRKSEPTEQISPSLDSLPTSAPPPVLPANTERLRSLRIHVELLDRLMNLVGELTLIRNQAQVSFQDEEGESRNILQRLNSVTSELQDTVLQTRMQPVGNLFGRFPRMVRDLARQLGKEVEVVTIGQDVELDKTVLERLSDPLMHLIRNSIDHGIESPELRVAQGKPSLGKIVLTATPSDGQVAIEIKDDGRGIDAEAIKAKALALGLRTATELQRMSQRELYSLILLPGFSTAKQVTDVSGRGVGMDVVKTNLEELEGTLSIDSILGKGTTISLRVPLTLAIVPCLIATCNDNRYAIPQRELEEIVCLHPGGKHNLEQAFDTEVLRLRGSLIPVVRLEEVLLRTKPFTSQDKADILALHESQIESRTKIEYLLVLRSQGRRFALLVDHVLGREEIVVKPMHSALKRIGIFSGATLMGDGQAALIVNAEGIMTHSRCFAVEITDSKIGSIRDPHEVHRVLLFEYGPTEQFALPLIQVKRVELLAMSRVEYVGSKEYVTIDGQSTRILRLSQAMHVSECDPLESMFLILPKFVSEPMGILASRIVDTESLAIQLQPSEGEPGVLGTAIVRNRLSLFLDIQSLREHVFGARTAAADLTCEKEVVEEPKHYPGKRVLLVDDTPFFREVVRRYLADLDVEITTAVDGNDGLQALQNGSFDLVVSDIEMPNMNGWEFCKAAREQGHQIPFMALTSLAKADHEKQAKDCGFDDFEEKLDHDRLKQKVCYWLSESETRRLQDARR